MGCGNNSSAPSRLAVAGLGVALALSTQSPAECPGALIDTAHRHAAARHSSRGAPQPGGRSRSVRPTRPWWSTPTPAARSTPSNENAPPAPGLDHQGDDALPAVREARQRRDEPARRRSPCRATRPASRRPSSACGPVRPSRSRTPSRRSSPARPTTWRSRSPRPSAATKTRFARMMTRKAHALGMSRTTYVNASGLPDNRQITTARDLTILGRAIQDRFPTYYQFFSTPSFTYAGQVHRQPQPPDGAASRAWTASRPATPTRPASTSCPTSAATATTSSRW